MSKNIDYQIHEHLYQKLIISGAEGWGGESYSSRMKSWDDTISELIRSNVFPKAPSSLLELGSGAGDVSIKFAQHGYDVTGIEISETAVKWAQQKVNSLNVEAQFYKGNACDLSQFDDLLFDTVVDGNCFHCIIGSDRQLFLREVHRILKDAGIFYVSTMIGDPKKSKSNFEYDSKSRCQIQNGVFYRYMGTQDAILSELTQSGFEILKFNITHNSWWDHLSCIVKKK